LLEAVKGPGRGRELISIKLLQDFGAAGKKFSSVLQKKAELFNVVYTTKNAKRRADVMIVKSDDRRTTKRVIAEIPLEVVTLPITIAKGSQSSQTQNISCFGLYCKLDQYIPPFTNVEVNLFLPQKQNAQSPSKISFRGIVVRTEPVETGDNKEYNIAIFAPSGIDLKDQPIMHSIGD
jgi:hypothetical protein